MNRAENERRLRSDAVATVAAMCAGSDRWDRAPALKSLLRAASVHGVSGAVAQQLLSSGVLDDSQASEVRALRAESLARHLRLVDAALEVGGLLESRGIPYAVVKGPVIASIHHDVPWVRTAIDVDVLVAPPLFGEAVTTLTESGLELRARNWPLLADSRHAELTLTTHTGVIIDLHWSLVPGSELRAARRLATGELLSRSRPAQIGPGTFVSTLDATDTLIHLCVHGADSGADRLVWLYDVHSAVQAQPPDWDEVISRCSQYRVGAQVVLMLSRAARVFGTSFPQELPRELAATHWALASAVVDRVSAPCAAYPYRSLSRWLARGVRDEPLLAMRSLAVNGSGWLMAGGFRNRLRSDVPFAPDDPRGALYDGGGGLTDYLRAVAAESGETYVEEPSISRNGRREGGPSRWARRRATPRRPPL